MPITTAYTRYVLSGGLPGGERWACGIAGNPTDNTGTAQVVANAEVNQAAWLNFRGALRAINPATVSITTLTVYQYDAGATAASDVGTAVVSEAGTASGVLPNQTALVSTYRTGTNTGRGRGRSYWPALGITMAGGGLTATTALATLADTLGELCEHIGALVISEAAGQGFIVTSVTIDNRTDVVRARAGRLSPTRVTVQVPD